jgi:hypothetical protein
MVDSRAAYRSYISAFNVTDSKGAFSSGYYVPMRHDSIADKIAARVTIHPTSFQAIVGGIGFGKTTQLLGAFTAAEALGDLVCIYVDVGAEQQLSALVPSLLLTLASLHLLPLVIPEQQDGTFEKAKKEVERHAHGHWDDDHGYPDYDDDGISWQSGILKEPQPVDDQIAAIESHVKDIANRLGKPVVVFFDGLDRVSNMSKLIGLLTQDLRAFGRLGIGCVLVLPERLLFGAERAFLDQLEWLPLLAMDIRRNTDLQDYLKEVLAKRAPPNLLSDEAKQNLVRFSGGVLRDLIVLARTAGTQAFMAASETIEAQHVSEAADQYGRKRLIGVSKEQLATLQRVQKTGEFVESNDSDIALLSSGAVLQYSRPESRYEVHPTLVDLLKAKGRP